MNNIPDSSSMSVQADIAAIGNISIVPALLDVICRTTGMGFAAIASVTADSWIACAVQDNIDFGLKPGGALKLETTICHEIREHQHAVAIDHVSKDPEYASHHTPRMYGFQSYISVPIFRRDKSFFGTLCAIDPKPANLNNPGVIGMFHLYAELISFHLDSIEQLDSAKSKLIEERGNTELREQFIAVLGHDLRNPLTAITTSAQLLEERQTDNTSLRLTRIIKNSAYRMKGLIGNILDFAQGKLGGGLVLDYEHTDTLLTELNQVISELQIIWQGRMITCEWQLAEKVYCDSSRIAQLFSNLLGNALSYGDPAYAVKVKASSDKNGFMLAVTNRGEQIPSALIETIFKPFSRGSKGSNQQGLGLGLYIASSIAAAHGGSLVVSSTAEETIFTLTIPAQ